MKRQLIYAPFYALLAVLMIACTGTRDAYRAADSPLEMATVVGEHYFALVKEAADLKEAGTLTGSNLETVREADRIAKPLVIELTNAIAAYQAAQDSESEAALQAALNEAVRAVNSFINAVKAVRRPS